MGGKHVLYHVDYITCLPPPLHYQGHREVVHILQNPGEWMLETEPSTAGSSTSASSESEEQREAAETESSTSANNSANLTVTSEQAR